jgi:2-oxoglutarate ferredoxin oxidoreductase subunit alpha
MSDLDMGMNLHTTRKFVYPDQTMDRGKVLSEADLEELEGNWGRYRDVDGDGIAYRTIPGNNHPNSAYFTRGTGHNENAVYSERPDDWEKNMGRIHRKMETAREILPQPVTVNVDGASFGIITYGSNDHAVEETRDMLFTHNQIKTDYQRVRALPAAQAILDFVAAHDYVYLIENNADGQLADILRLEQPEYATRIRKVNRNNGMPLDAEWIYNTIMEMEG